MTIEDLIAAQQEEAKVHVKRAVLIEQIFKAENMKVDNNDANRHFLQIASENQIPEAELGPFPGGGFRFDFTGPWPPYHFVGGELDDR